MDNLITNDTLFFQLHAYKTASGRSYLRCGIACQAKKATKDQVIWPEVKIVPIVFIQKKINLYLMKIQIFFLENFFDLYLMKIQIYFYSKKISDQ